jgi:hypothetical protein
MKNSSETAVTERRMLPAIAAATVVVPLLFLALAGCDERPSLTYTVTVTRPDGNVHRTYTIRSKDRPRIGERESGCMFLFNNSLDDCWNSEPIPVGWAFSVEASSDAEEVPRDHLMKVPPQPRRRDSGDDFDVFNTVIAPSLVCP